MVLAAVFQHLRPGDWFVFDAGGYEDGDLLYAEVIGIMRTIPTAFDPVGEGRGGYRVRVHCSADIAQRTVDGIVDHYTFAYVDESCARLSPSQAQQAKWAGWPAERRFLVTLGVELPEYRS